MNPQRSLLTLLVSGAVVFGAPALALAGEGETQTVTIEAPPTNTTTTTTTTTTTAPEQPASTTTPSSPEAEAPQVQSVGTQHPSRRHAPGPKKSPAPATTKTGAETSVKLGKKAPSPKTLTPAIPLDLSGSLSGVPAFFIESFQIPPFLLPIFQAAGTAYDVPWQVLAAINEVETDYGRDLNVSSAGAEGWMQFLPVEWAQYGVDANGDGYRDPYNPADAIFTAARYLHAAGGSSDIKAAVYSYNHSPAYVESVMLRAELLGGTPSELLGAITGLTEARFPVHAASHYSDGFPDLPLSGTGSSGAVAGTTIYTEAGAPVIAVQDGEVVATGNSRELGNYISLRDGYGNTYTYAELGEVSTVYPVLQPHVDSHVSPRIAGQGNTHEAAPSGPASAGAQASSPLSEGSTLSELALGADATLEGAPSSAHPHAEQRAAPSTPSSSTLPAGVSEFTEGNEDVYLHPLHAGAQVIAGTVLGHVGQGAALAAPHIVFQIRPAGVGAPLIDPKPILDGWVALENTSIFRARGENPFLATSPTVGQVLLESGEQLQSQVLADTGITLSPCGRADVQGGRVSSRVLAMLEYLSVSGLKPTVAGLSCSADAAAAGASEESAQITAINGTPVAGHQGPGTVADETERKLLELQGPNRPARIESLMSYPGAAGAQTSQRASDYIQVLYGASAVLKGTVKAGVDNALSPTDWARLVARLGEIPDPTVASAPSASALPDSAQGEGTEGEAGGNN